jgi:high-affinity iron transporter
LRTNQEQVGVTAERWRAIAKIAGGTLIIVLALVVVAALIWAALTAAGNPDPTNPEVRRHMTPLAAVIGAGILVFREGLETILVLSAITASMAGANAFQRRPVATGGAIGLAATFATWFIVVAILSQVNLPEYQLQAATGWLAVIVLLVVMNWFFHKIYWTGWIQVHNRQKRRLMRLPGDARQKLLLGLALVGFASVYREGFEVVLFLQSWRLEAGIWAVAAGAGIGLFLTGAVGAITFVGHHRLPYKRMLVLTGVMLGVVLLVMVGEEINEMQLAQWMSTTPLPGNPVWPDWMGTWFSLFPNWETLIAMAVSAVLVLGSYFGASYLRVIRPKRRGERGAVRPTQAPSDPITSRG